ncbi:MAG: DUF4118 domain-containing protein [Ardenticatenales bacterium]
MDNDGERLLLLAIGPLIAIGIAIVLTPLREVTTASNLTFVFIVLTIVVAEYGGRLAAVATALVSALSLDFFLTRPYLRLSIADKHDVIAFLGLAVCGVVAALIGSYRTERLAERRLRRRLNGLLDRAMDELVAPGSADVRAAELLGACMAALPLAAIVLRDAGHHVVAAVPGDRPEPDADLPPGALHAAHAAAPGARPHELNLPAGGARIPLSVGGRAVGWLDVWGRENGGAAGGDARRALGHVARVAAVMMAPRSHP